MISQVYQDILQDNIRPSVSWSSTEVNIEDVAITTGVNKQKNDFNRKGFVKRKFFLTIVQVWFTILGHFWWSLLLPKKRQSVIKSKDLHTFSLCTVNVFSKNKQTNKKLIIVCIYLFRQTVFVADQMTIKSNFMTNSRVHILFPATINNYLM